MNFSLVLSDLSHEIPGHIVATMTLAHYMYMLQCITQTKNVFHIYTPVL